MILYDNKLHCSSRKIGKGISFCGRYVFTTRVISSTYFNITFHTTADAAYLEQISQNIEFDEMKLTSVRISGAFISFILSEVKTAEGITVEVTYIAMKQNSGWNSLMCSKENLILEDISYFCSLLQQIICLEFMQLM